MRLRWYCRVSKHSEAVIPAQAGIQVFCLFKKDMMPKHFYVYMLASQRNGTLYIGMTSNWQRRITEHKEHLRKGFTETYDVTKLVYIERHETFDVAVTREKQLKTWQRKWKMRLIEEMNPDWEDLTEKKDFVIS
jgi:putative endonuclease